MNSSPRNIKIPLVDGFGPYDIEVGSTMPVLHKKYILRYCA